MVRLTKILWLLLSVGAAIGGAQIGGEAQLIAIYLIGVLTMPLGIVVYILGSYAHGFLSAVGNNSSFVVNIIMSLLAITSGYVQWFILLPKLVNRMRTERSPKVWGLVLVGLIAIIYALYRFYLHVFPSASN